MSHTLVQCPDLVVPNGQTSSNVLKAREVYDDAREIIILAGTGATAGTLQTTDDPDAVAPTFYTIQSGAPLADLATPLATKAVWLKEGWARGLKIVLAAPPGAPVTYKVFKRIESPSSY